VALDQKYISKETFEKVYNQAEKVAKTVSNFITYLIEHNRRTKQTKSTK